MPKVGQVTASDPLPAEEIPKAAKVAYVKSQGQTRPHHCHGQMPGCAGQCPPAMWGCRSCWSKLPTKLRQKIWEAYRPGQALLRDSSQRSLSAILYVLTVMQSEHGEQVMPSTNPIKVLDHGYIRLVESWGHGDAGVIKAPEEDTGIRHDYECGIVEAARQSTQASFRSWEPYWICEQCHAWTPQEEKPDTTGQLDWCETEGNPHEWKRYPKGDMGLLEFLYTGKPQHATPFEFAGSIIEVQAPIFVFREWHRHRTQSYNEMSARYAPLPDLNYVPQWDVLKQRGEATTKNKQASGTEPFNEDMSKAWHGRLPSVYEYLQKVYTDGLMAGVPKELARIVLPVGRYTRMRASANLRNWLAFMTLRADPQAQWEIRMYANVLGVILSECFPKTFKLFQIAREAATPRPA